LSCGQRGKAAKGLPWGQSPVDSRL
jgi:hypothetical protein